MAVETSAVQISVNVVDNTSSQVLSGVEQNLNKLGAAGTTSGAKMKQGLEQAGAGALSAREKTRLLTEEFGIRIPRAMQTLISRSEVAQKAMNALGTAMIGLAGIQIGAMMFEAAIQGAEKLWHNVLNVNQAVEDYHAEVAKAKQEDFGNTKSIETTRLRIDEATESVRKYEAEVAAQQQKARSWDSPLLALIPFGLGPALSIYHTKQAHDAQARAMDAQREVDKLTPAKAEQQHELTLLKIRRDHPDALGRELAENQENFAYDAAREGSYDNPFASNAGLEKKQVLDQIARQQAKKEGGRGGAGDAKSQALELARIHEQAYESGLRGSELYHAQEAAAIKDLENKGIASATAVNDIHTKFHNEEMNRLRAQQAEIDNLRQETGMLGLTGVARIEQEGRNRIANLSPDLEPIQRAQAEAEIRKQTAFAVTEELKKEGDERQKSAAEIAERQRRASNETARIEEEARVKFLSAEKQKTAAIVEELSERLAKYQEELQAQEISQDDYNRRVAAAQMHANAEMIEASREARKKMAGEFESIFKGLEDPKRYLKEMGDKAAGNAAAMLMQRFQQRGQLSQGISEHPSLSGDFLGGFGVGKKKTSTEAAKATGSHDASSTPLGIFSVAQATIQIGSASIAAGIGGGSTAAGNAALSAPGSTSLLASNRSAGLMQSGYTGTSGGINSSIDNVTQGLSSAKQLNAVIAKQNTWSTGAAFGLDSKSGNGLMAGGSGTTVAGNEVIDASNISAPGSGESSSLIGVSKAGSGNMAGAMGTASGVLGVYSASQGSGGFGGAAKGAMSGAEAGAMFGPAGMAVGAVVGGTLGFMGSGEQARVYDLKTVRPRIGNDKDAYEQGSMDYLSAYSDLQSLYNEAFKATSAMGMAGRRYRNEHISPEIKEAEGKLSAQEKAGRSMYSASAASYATGTPYVAETGLNWNHAGERIMSAPDNQQVIKAITEGNQNIMPVQPASMGDVHLHVHAIDAKSSIQFLQANKQNIRAALNESYAENSGGGL